MSMLYSKFKSMGKFWKSLWGLFKYFSSKYMKLNVIMQHHRQAIYNQTHLAIAFSSWTFKKNIQYGVNLPNALIKHLCKKCLKSKKIFHHYEQECTWQRRKWNLNTYLIRVLHIKAIILKYWYLRFMWHYKALNKTSSLLCRITKQTENY